jgi:hypothetical protein
VLALPSFVYICTCVDSVCIVLLTVMPTVVSSLTTEVSVEQRENVVNFVVCLCEC